MPNFLAHLTVDYFCSWNFIAVFIIPRFVVIKDR